MQTPQFFCEFADQPWMSWLLICLCRQLERQEWLKAIDLRIREQEHEQTGIVPDLPEWKFFYHGMGLCLSGPNNEILDVDFHENDVQTVDPYFFARRVMNLENPEGPEEKLRTWLPDEELIIVGIRELQGKQLIPKDSHTFKLNPKYKSDWAMIREISFRDDRTFQEFLNKIEKDLRQSDKLEQWLLKKLMFEKTKASAFKAIVSSLSEKNKLEICSNTLNGNLDNKAAAAVKILDEMKNAPVGLVQRVLYRLNPNQHHPYIAHTICEFLLKRKIEPKKCLAILRNFSDKRKVNGYLGNPYDYELAHLVTVYSPAEGLPLLRRALRSSTPAAVEATSALLSRIDEDWSNAELIKVIEEDVFKENPVSKRYVTAALMNSKHKDYATAGEKLKPMSREREPGEIGYTFDEVLETNMGEFFSLALEKAEQDLRTINTNALRSAAMNEPKGQNSRSGFWSKLWRIFEKD